ncbi:uncharacterized protein LOC134823390 [Bolinopsis microptera]|uniref:uncharacterized protein LOC134823390 n=1 Tax=Bolinopsis microptera TaxID=2820187 RepID=UPI003078CC0D
MVFPYQRNYQQSTGWPTINDTTCPKGEWKYVDRWGKKPKVNWIANLTVGWIPLLAIATYYCTYRWNVIREEERAVLAAHFAQNPSDSELEADIDDIYQTYKKSTLAQNSKASKFREFVSQFKTHKEKMGYTKTDIMRIFKDD